MSECAFCPNVANSREHIFSDWMNALLPGKKVWRKRNSDGSSPAPFITGGLDLKAKVVCGACNKGWMSRLENEHAKPALADLIVGTKKLQISKQRARSISLFAYKTAVVSECMNRELRFPGFFPRSTRHKFRETFEIPNNVRIWVARFIPGRGGHFFSVYHPAPERAIELYVCNFHVGAFVFQVLVEHKPMSLTVFPNAGLDHFGVEIFPNGPVHLNCRLHVFYFIFVHTPPLFLRIIHLTPLLSASFIPYPYRKNIDYKTAQTRSVLSLHLPDFRNHRNFDSASKYHAL